MALMLIDFLHDGHTLAAIVERDAQTGEPVRALLIVPPDPPRDPGDYRIILYHALSGTDEEEVGCQGTAAEAIQFALARYDQRFPVLRQNGWWSFSPQPRDAQGGDGAAQQDHLVVAPDGSSDVQSLEDAMRVAAPGATLLLRAGTHRLSRPLEIDQPLSLIGDGRESTYVVCTSPGCVVQVSGNGCFSASNVTFTHEGAQGANVLEVACEEIDLRHCGFLGGVRDEAAQGGGVGLLLLGQVRGTVADCEASDNGLHGIYVGEQAQPVLEANTCEGNTYNGIGGYVVGRAGVAISASVAW
jgi:parallel beta-helix repeat protein